MEYNLTDLLMTFDTYDEQPEMERVVYTRKDGINITLEIERNSNKLIVVVKDNKITYTKCAYLFCKAIRVLNVENKLLEIIGGSQSSPYVRTYLSLEGFESIFNLESRYEVDE